MLFKIVVTAAIFMVLLLITATTFNVPQRVRDWMMLAGFSLAPVVLVGLLINLWSN